jgi:hypothetical protein
MLKRIEGRQGEWNEFVEFQKEGSKISFIAQKSSHLKVVWDAVATPLWYVYRNVRGIGGAVKTLDFSYHKEIAVDKALKAATAELETK